MPAPARTGQATRQSLTKGRTELHDAAQHPTRLLQRLFAFTSQRQRMGMMGDGAEFDGHSMRPPVGRACCLSAERGVVD